MPAELTWLAAFLIGLVGSVHCIGMCGAIVTVLAMNIAPERRASRVYHGALLSAYHAGRIASYSVAGALVGAGSAQLFDPLDPHTAASAGRWIGAVFLALLGLYIGEWWRVLVHLERAGAMLWRRLQPAIRRLVPVRGVASALALGALWGWLPCGLVYSTLAWSLHAADPVESARLMAAFGLGTVPALAVTAQAGARLRDWAQSKVLRRAIGALLIAAAVVMVAAPHPHGAAPAGHGPNAPHRHS